MNYDAADQASGYLSIRWMKDEVVVDAEVSSVSQSMVSTLIYPMRRIWSDQSDHKVCEAPNFGGMGSKFKVVAPAGEKPGQPVRKVMVKRQNPHF